MIDTSIEISIIIPCFNDGVYIQETLNSVNNQTYQNIEIIIIDDASTDKQTLKTLESLQQNNLTIIYSDNNAGPSVARNKGISIAKGKYILPLDADDTIAPTYLEKARDILIDNSHIGIVYCKAKLFGKKDEPWDLPPYKFPNILAGNMIFATALYRKKDWETVGGYDERMRYGNEDYDFWLSLIDQGVEVFQIPEILFHYRIKSSSRSTQLDEQKHLKIDTFEQIFFNHKDLYLKHIRSIFEKLDTQQQDLLLKDNKIRQLHTHFQEKDNEIQQLHTHLQKKDNEIQQLHTHLQKKDNEILQLHKLGEDLNYARSIVSLRDTQVQFKNKHIDFLQALTLKRRLKNQVKKVLPNTLLTLAGFQPFEPIIFPENEFPKELTEDLTVSLELNTYTYHIPKLTPAIKDEIRSFIHKPLISIIMPVYNIDPKWLDIAIGTITDQWYENWELCLADDKSTNQETIEYLRQIDNPKIKITYLEENLNISGASNAALALATGEYIALMDNDDEITPDALYEILKVINEKNAEFIYSDEDFISTEGICSNPHFKPDFSPDLLLSHNYITHFTCFKRDLLDKVGHFNPKYDGAQDYDLFLRLTEQTKNIYHIQKVLYHWRTLETSTSANSEAKPEALERGKLLIQDALKRREIDANVYNGNLHHYFRVKYNLINNPLVSIIIPFKDKPELLDMCINSILDKSTYQNYEIIGISNNSEENETFEMMKLLENKDKRVSFYEYNVEFNYSDINNHGVNTYAKGEHVLLLNNDIEIISPDWIESMLEHSQRKSVGCVGAKLYYPNDTIQHAGIIIGLGGYAGHSHKMSPRDSPGYFNRLNIVQNLSAVTAACLMIKRSIYDEINGLDTVNFKVAYNDVDFCLRVRDKGYLNIYTPYAQMYHHESISRGYETTPEKIARFQTEKDALIEKHSFILKNGDPYYNPGLTLAKEDFSIWIK